MTTEQALRMAFDYAGYYRDKSPFEVADMILEYVKRKENGTDNDSGNLTSSSTGTNEEAENLEQKE